MSKSHTVELPANFVFAPKVEFVWDDEDTGVRIGRYTPGNTYNCAAIPRHDRLRAKCAEWLSAGRITVTPVGGFKITKVTIPVAKQEA